MEAATMPSPAMPGQETGPEASPSAKAKTATCCWTVEQMMTVEIDGSRVVHDDEDVPAVIVRVPAFVAHHLAHVLDDWTTIGEIMESGRGSDERELAVALHEAARAASDPGANRCDCLPPARLADDPG
jgi:hypothetical protein